MVYKLGEKGYWKPHYQLALVRPDHIALSAEEGDSENIECMPESLSGTVPLLMSRDRASKRGRMVYTLAAFVLRTRSRFLLRRK